MQPKDLFNLSAPLYRDPARPLVSLSDSIVETLPQHGNNLLPLLALKKEEIATVPANDSRMIAFDATLSYLGDLKKTISPQEGIELIDPVSRLDLKVLYTYFIRCADIALKFDDTQKTEAILRDAEEVEKVILEHSAGQGTGFIKYEDLVLNNPANDMRTFTSGDIGLSEAHFYFAHQMVEFNFGQAINYLMQAKQSTGGYEVGTLIKSASYELKKNSPILDKFDDFDTGHFAHFRRMFMSNEHKQPKELGPSGAYSGKMPFVEAILFSGHDPEGEIFKYFRGFKEYLPVKEVQQIDTLLADNDNDLIKHIVTNFADQPEVANDTLDTLADICDDIMQFRMYHEKMVIKHLGAQFIGSGKGNGSADFLAEKREIGYRYKSILNSCKL